MAVNFGQSGVPTQAGCGSIFLSQMDRTGFLLIAATDAARTAAERREAFGQLVAIHQDAAFATAYAVLGDRDAAQDATLEAFLDAWRALGSLREPSAFSAWLRTLVRTRALRYVGSRGSAAPLFEAVQVAGPCLGNPPIDFEHALRLLPEVEREAVVLFYVVGLSREELAAFVGVSPVAAKKRLAKARARLRTEFINMEAEQFKSALPSQSDIIRQQTLLLTGQFAELLASRRPILLALADCIAQAGGGPVGAAFADMRDQVVAGEAMADAMLRHPNVFDPVDAQAVLFGEEMGLLDQIMRRIANGERLESVEALRAQYFHAPGGAPGNLYL
jgi:RNA polymerase sigma-70 factor (ECF subfamily)